MLTARPSRHILTDEERLAYIEAEKCLMSKPAKLGLSPAARTRFDEFQMVHVLQTPEVHFVVCYIYHCRLQVPHSDHFRALFYPSIVCMFTHTSMCWRLSATILVPSHIGTKVSTLMIGSHRSFSILILALAEMVLDHPSASPTDRSRITSMLLVLDNHKPAIALTAISTSAWASLQRPVSSRTA